MEDVSNPGRHDEVVPSIGRQGDEKEDQQEEAEMKEETSWSPFGYRRLQDMPVRTSLVGVLGWLAHARVRSALGHRTIHHTRQSTQSTQGEVLSSEVIAKWTNPPNADDPDAWKKDMEEMMALLETAVQSEMNSTIEARVGPDGQVEEEASNFANLLNTISQSPDTLFPMCSPVGFVTRIPHLLCAITVI